MERFRSWLRSSPSSPTLAAERTDGTCTSVEALLAAAVPLLAARCEAEAKIQRLGWINERDHLQKWSEMVVTELANGPDRRCRIGRSHRVDMAEWPRVGPVDLTVTGPGDAKPAFIELKAGSNRNALTACAWDLLKLSLALHRGDTDCAYLLAAAPVSLWLEPIRGVEFFDTGDWQLDPVRSRFEDWWREWQRRNDPAPLFVPAGGHTHHLSAAGFFVADAKWEIRLSRVGGPRPLVAWTPYAD